MKREELGLCLGQLSRLWRAEIDRRVSIHGLTDAQGLTLLHLSRLREPVTQKVLATMVGVREPTMTRMLDRLEADGLVTREVAEDDRRARLIRLDPKAGPVLTRIQKVVEALRSDLFHDIEDADIDICLGVLRKLIGRFGDIEPPGTPVPETRFTIEKA